MNNNKRNEKYAEQARQSLRKCKMTKKKNKLEQKEWVPFRTESDMAGAEQTERGTQKKQNVVIYDVSEMSHMPTISNGTLERFSSLSKDTKNGF